MLHLRSVKEWGGNPALKGTQARLSFNPPPVHSTPPDWFPYLRLLFFEYMTSLLECDADEERAEKEEDRHEEHISAVLTARSQQHPVPFQAIHLAQVQWL
jgi:hypothetical protein